VTNKLATCKSAPCGVDRRHCGVAQAVVVWYAVKSQLKLLASPCGSTIRTHGGQCLSKALHTVGAYNLSEVSICAGGSIENFKV